MQFALPKRRRVGLGAAAPFGFGEEEEEEDVAGTVRRLEHEGACHALAGRWGAALSCFDEAIARSAAITSTCAALHEQKAQVLLALHRYFEAVQAAATALAHAPAFGDAALTLARAQLQLGEPVLALRSAEQALVLGCADAAEELRHIEDALLMAARATHGQFSGAELALAMRSSQQ